MNDNKPNDVDLSERASLILTAENGARLYLGDLVAAAYASRIDVHVVVNCAPRHVARSPAAAVTAEHYLEIDLSDAPQVSIADDGKVSFDDVAKHFDASSEFIDSAIERGDSVLVHCAGGVSRSATIVLSYLIAKRRMTLRDAFRLVQRQRSVIAPNSSFFNALLALESKTHQQRTTAKLALNVHQRIYHFIDDDDNDDV